ncbi:hypothetical protein [Streptomyces phaeoluteigriseus]|uniref:hypothetical protein n=1 Tax=Streptomyces phaeoluteigriseus TaxID=114686 RepID=UPI003692D39D
MPLKDVMSPHVNDLAMRRACEELLYIDARSTPRTRSGRVRLDWATPKQQVLQAMLVTCLMSSSQAPHPVEHPGKRCLSGIQGYLNVILSRPDVLEVYTNTACRIASRLMPVRYNGGHIAGIPGLRFLNHTKRRVRLLHLPTGARLDLIESHVSSWFTVRDMRRTFQQETRWHDATKMERLWDRPDLTRDEEAHKELWALKPCTPLRSAIMTRAMSFWYKNDIYPDWMPPLPGTHYPRLVWDVDPEERQPKAAHIGALLTTSPIAIPGAAFHEHGADDGLLILGAGGVNLISADPIARVLRRGPS